MAYGKIQETFWDDPTIRSLSERGRLLMLYLLTCRHRTRLGLFVLDPGYAAADLQWDREEMETCLQELVEKGRIEYDPDHRCVFLPRFLKYNTLENHKVVTGARAELGSIPDTPLLVPLLDAIVENSRPHYLPIIEELRNRIAYRFPNGIGNGMANGIGNGIAYRGTAQALALTQAVTLTGGGEDRSNSDSQQDAPRSGDPAPPPPSWMARLEAWLGNSSDCLDGVGDLTRNPELWAQGVLGLYGPTGTEEKLMAGVSEEHRPKAFATALLRFKAEGQDWDGKFFRGILAKVIQERQPKATTPDFGDETERDAKRRQEAQRRKQQADSAEAEAERRADQEAWAWYRELAEGARRAIERDAERRVRAILSGLDNGERTEVMERMALLQAVRDAMEGSEGASAA